jgi:glycosyltransferase involved in cell wall biosynthesis
MKMKHWEHYFWKKATRLVAVSESEKRTMSKVREDVELIPNGVDIEKFQPKADRPKEKRILLIGDFKWVQNRDCAKFIIQEIWPLIPSRLGLKLWIVGKKIPREIRHLTKDENVIFDENAPEETEKIYEQADILLAPIRIGGGTNFKILEAMASGVPVLTTLLGIEGIKARANEHVLVANSPSDLARMVEKLCSDEVLVSKLTKNARSLIEKEYEWEKIAKELDDVYKSVL